MCNHDARERFIYIIMILCVGVSNVHFQSFSSIFKDLFFAMLSEMAVDWIKHSFIIKFNLISQRTYTSHLEHLAMSALKITFILYQINT
ncbi:hypothetical protein HZS_6671 [Henneguya salminicola]|nr:hypothetical protein HZS_6671 [Henneguya salminicola]